MSCNNSERRSTRRMIRALTLTTLLAVLDAQAWAAPNLLANGSFEDHVATIAVPGGTAELINSLGALPGGGWQVDALGGGPILLNGNAYGTQTPPGPADGQQFLYLSNGGIAGARISQSVALTPGLYTLTFAIGGWALKNQAYQPTLDVQVSGAVGSLLSVPEAGVKFDGVTTNLPSPAWKSVTEQFAVATAGTYKLSFGVASPSGPNFATLDAVSLTAASPVPEPHAMWLTLAGCLALAGLVRGRQQARS
jgi:hypothetical protein